MSNGKKAESIKTNKNGDSTSAFRILVINPGSTSTKLAFFEAENEKMRHTVLHPAAQLKPFKRIMDQAEFRLNLVRAFLASQSINLKSLRAVVGRGGLLKPIPGGVYAVNRAMLDDLREARFGEHASNLGAVLAHRIAQEAGCPAYIVDPVVVDEMEDMARVSGLPELKRRSIFHALNHKFVARAAAQMMNKAYEKSCIIVAHLGGGISVGAHRNGRVIDVNNALDGDGPFAPERAGSLPAGQLMDLCFSGSVTLAEMKRKLIGGGGLMAFRGSNSFTDLQKAVDNGDADAAFLCEAMAYKISQEIAKHSATLKGRIDCIVLTGGLANDETFIAKIIERVRHLAPVQVIPGEREMLSLAAGVLALLTKRQKPMEYT
jgi:butyrate kinase